MECVESLKNEGITQSIEFGCGQVIKGLVKKIAPEITVNNMNSLEEFKAAEGMING